MHVTIPYTPRDAFRPLHGNGKRWAVVVAHRRSGKTVAAVNHLLKGAVTCAKPAPRFAYVAPFRQQAKIVAWDYLKRYSAPLPGRQVSEGELHVKLDRDARVTLYGADNFEALRGIYLDGVVVDEPADMDPEVWTSILRPALADRGGWCMWIGTPKGRNAFFRLYERALADPEFHTLFLPASQSGILPQHELVSARNAMGQEAYDREFECSFEAPVPGAIYAGEINQLRAARRIVDFPHEHGHPLYTFWDLGQSDYTCIWLLQFVGRDVLALDYHSATGKTPAWYADVCTGWERDFGRKIGRHYLPHDANTRDRGGKTWVADLEEAGLRGMEIVPRTPDIWRGINQVRGLLPRFFIHKTRCSRPFGEGEQAIPSGLDCLEYYSKREDNLGSGVIAEKPVHNEFSHGADALRTFGEAYSCNLLDGGGAASEVQRAASTRRVITATREPAREQTGFYPKRRFTVTR